MYLRIPLFFAILLVLFNNSFGQSQSKIDSLTDLLSTGLSDQEKADLYLDLSYEYTDNFDKAVDYAEKALTLSEDIEYGEGQIVALTNLGAAYWRISDLDKAESYFRESLKVAKQHDIQPRKASGYNNLGVLYKTKGKYDIALHYYDSAMSIGEEVDDPKTLAGSLNNIARLLVIQSKHDSSLHYYLKSLELYKQLDDKMNVSKVYTNIGLAYENLGNLPKALEYHHNALTLAERLESGWDMSSGFTNISRIHAYQGEYQKAIVYMKKSLEWDLVIGNQPRLANTYANLGGYYRETEAYDSAVFYHEKGLAITKTMESQTHLASVFNALGNDHLALKNYDKARYYLNKSMEICQEIEPLDVMASLFILFGKLNLEQANYEEAIDHLKNAVTLAEQLDLPIKATDAYQLLASAQHAYGDYKEAYESFDLYHAYYDTLLGETKASEIATLEVRYETEKKEREIQSLNQQARIQSLELDRKNQNLLLLIILVVLLSLLAGFIYVFNRQKSLSLQHKAQNMEQRLLRTQMSPHFIFNSMTAIQDYMVQGNAKEAGSYLAKFSKLIRQVLDNSRNEFITLHDEVNMLENYLSLQNLRRDVPFHYSIEVNDKIDPQEIAIPPMFAQPFVENAIEHGLSGLQQNAHIIIRFQQKEDHLLLEVSDNGEGIEKSIKTKPSTHESHATKITKERITLFKQMLKKEISFDLQSIQGKGTSILFQLPFKYVYE